MGQEPSTTSGRARSTSRRRIRPSPADRQRESPPRKCLFRIHLYRERIHLRMLARRRRLQLLHLAEGLPRAWRWDRTPSACGPTDTVGNRDETPAERSFQVVEPPQTTITSPQPSYTSREEPPITFTSSKSESTFKCSLDDPQEEPTTACTSPYSLPEHLSPGWHTFVVAATDKEGNTDPTPAKWNFNTAIYPPAPRRASSHVPKKARSPPATTRYRPNGAARPKR